MKDLHPLEPKSPVLSEEDRLNFRLSSLLVFIKENEKRKLPIWTYSALLCELLREVRSGLLYLSVSSSLDTVFTSCALLLKQDTAHTALLMLVERLSSFLPTTGFSIAICKFIREVLLPMLILLKSTGDGPKLEVISRVEHILSQPEALAAIQRLKQQEKHAKIPSISSPDFYEFVRKQPKTLLFERLRETFLKTRESSKLTMQEQRALLRRRCLSEVMPGKREARGELDMRIEEVPGLVQRGCQTIASTPYFLQLPEMYEESLRDESEDRHEVPGSFPPTKLLQAPLQSASPAEVLVEPSLELIPSPIIPHPEMPHFLEILRLEKEPDTPPTWELVCSRPNVKVYKKRSDDSPICMIKAYCELDHPPEVVFRAMVDVEVRRQWDKLFSELEAFDPHPYHDYLYYVVKVRGR